MDLRRVDANLLVALDAILTECNLTRAGERVGMTQSAMSGALARLRLQLEDPLLVRAGRQFEPTPRAVALRPMVRDAVEAVTRTLQARPAFDPITSTRTFTITASDYALSVLSAPLLARVRHEAPGVTLEFDPLPSTAIVDSSDLQRQDIVIAGNSRDLPGRRQTVFIDRFVVLVDRNNPALEDGRLTLKAIGELPVSIGIFGAGVTTPGDDMLEAGGITPRLVTISRGFLSTPFLIAGSNRIGIVPARVAERVGPALGLVVADTPLPETELVEAAHWPPSTSNDPGLQWLLAQLTPSLVDPLTAA